jgi:molybdenum cofactor synthesis domain-containing protein
MGKIKIGILTVSDRCSAGTVSDMSGPAVAGVFSGCGYQVEAVRIVPDDVRAIAAEVILFADSEQCDVVLTTGGTGFAPRDVTPEACAAVIEREAPGIAAFLLNAGLAETPFAALGRGRAGIRGRTLIVNLPGSPRAAGHLARELLQIIPHAVHIMQGGADGHAAAKEQC